MQPEPATTVPGLRYEGGPPPAPGGVRQIAPGVHWLRMPLPISLAHINLWLVEDHGGYAIVDTGMQAPGSDTIWTQVLQEYTGDRGPTRVIVTHMHPDHAGMAGWLCRTYGVELWMTRTEYYTCRVLAADEPHDAPPEAVAFFTAAGFDAEALARYRKMFGMFGTAVSPMPQSYRRIRAGDVIGLGDDTLEVVMGNGHSPEHACLLSRARNLLIAGDQILPTISSNVSVWPTEPHANPLADWLASCERLRRVLPEDVLVLPAHGKPFRGAHQRLTTLIEEHEAGLEKLLALLASPCRAIDTFDALFRGPVKASNRIMATGEALAHLNYLLARGEIEVERDSAGVDYYRRR